MNGQKVNGLKVRTKYPEPITGLDITTTAVGTLRLRGRSRDRRKPDVQAFCRVNAAFLSPAASCSLVVCQDAPRHSPCETSVVVYRSLQCYVGSYSGPA